MMNNTPLSPMPPRTDRVLCAISGGADSVYLLLRLVSEGWNTAAAHYNHGLRGEESDRDERFVLALCERLGVPVISSRGAVADYARERSLGIEEAARELRYAFLESAADKLGAAWILTAHNADDNAETLLLNLTRGSGLRGLGGIPPRRGRILRPMLGITRSEIDAYLIERGEAHIEDSTNASDAYTRNKLRHNVIPVLREINPGFAAAAGRAARLLREDEEYLEGAARAFLAAAMEGDALPCAALREQPRPIASRALRIMSGASLSEVHVDALLRLIEGGGEAAALDLPGIRARRERGRLRFTSGESAVLPEITVPMEGRVRDSASGLIIESRVEPVFSGLARGINSSFNTFCFQNANICGTISCTPRRDGDRIRLRGRNCTKKLSDLYAEAGLSLEERAKNPVLRDERGPVAVFGFGVSSRCAAVIGEPARIISLGWEEDAQGDK